VDPLLTGSTAGRVRANGTLIERNAFDRPSLHRVDIRVQRRTAITSRMTIDAMFEVFNLFNRRNYNSFITNEANVRFGSAQPDTSAVAYQPRMMQFGFRLGF
jgi:hypothetical protein